MRRAAAFALFLLFLWVILPAFAIHGTPQQPAPVLVRAATPAATLFVWAALGATGVMLAAAGWQAHIAVERGWGLARRVMMALLTLLALGWVWLAAADGYREAMRLPPTFVTVRAATPGVYVWLMAALLLTGAAFLAAGWQLRRARQALVQRRALFALIDGPLDAGLALVDRRGVVRWSNTAGRAWLLAAGGRLRDEITPLVSGGEPVQQARTLSLGEDRRVAVKALRLPSGLIGVAAQPAPGEAARASFYEQFIRRIVHDMRNPLAAILAHAGNISAAPNADPDTWRNAARTIENEAGRLTRLVDSLLFDARLSYVPIAREAFDLADVVEEVFFQHDERAGAEGKTIAVETPPDPAPFEGDRDLLARALSNLVDNSLRYSPGGSLIRLTLEAAPDQYVIRVVDAGEGIPPEFLPDRIFEPLVRARPKDGRSGSGLGLSIVRKIAEIHGGAVRAESAPGEGTTMTLWLPQTRK
ncbi:MAG: HAMP domain-containing histidine kinase [Anaerolineae bacterium]|nr:HAMP domain-containing histidine kinase [Anaerolineae bacterium]